MTDNLDPYTTEDEETGFENNVLIEETVVWDTNEDAEPNYVVETDPVHLKTEIPDVTPAYMTTNEEFDQAHYFSILGNSVNEESVLPDITGISLDAGKGTNVTEDLNVNHYMNVDQNESLQLVMENPDILEPDMSLNNSLIINDEVFLYKMEGTEDIYAVQTADDGNGNLQRYQFKVKINDIGQYEAVPGTIEIQSEDSPLAQALNEVQTGQRTLIQEPLIQPENIKQEKMHAMSPVLPPVPDFLETEESNDFLVVNEDEVPGGESDSEQHYEEIYVTENIVPQTKEEEEVQQDISSEDLAKGKITDFETFHSEPNCDNVSVANEYISEDFIRNEHEEETIGQVEYLEEAYQENDFEEEYHTVEGMHITGDSEEDMDIEQNHLQTEEEDEDDDEDILRIGSTAPSPGNAEGEKNDASKQSMDPFSNKDISYFILKSQMPQVAAGIQTPNSYNPRSLLKKSYATHIARQQQQQQEQQEELDSEYETLPQTIVFPSVKVNNIPKANILNKTYKSVVIAPPIRNQVRQPRKQSITPVERIGSEIIVQEVTFAGNNILTTGNFLLPKKKLNPNEIYQISDSDEDYTPQKTRLRNKYRRHRRKSKLVEITISDSEDNTDDSVIEVRLSDETDDINKENIAESNRKRKLQDAENKTEMSFETGDPPKRKRGRPPKVKSLEPTANSTNVLPEDNVHRCTLCSKSFSRESSLKAHMQFHDAIQNEKRSESSSESSSCTDSTMDIVEKAFQCKTCSESFKTKFLLVKHEDSHKKVTEPPASLPHPCNFCDKSFSTSTLLNAHKKLHVKKHLTRNTCTTNVSPKKLASPRKSPPSPPPALKTPVQCVKCDQCGKSCPTADKLSVHKKLVHLTYPCANCKDTFNSKLLLDNHVRRRCVKSPKKRRRRSDLKQPTPAAKKTANNISGKSPDLMKTPILTCPICKEVFKTHTNLYRHRRIVHENCIPIPATNSSSSARKLSSSTRKSVKYGGIPLLLKCQKNLVFPKSNKKDS